MASRLSSFGGISGALTRSDGWRADQLRLSCRSTSASGEAADEQSAGAPPTGGDSPPCPQSVERRSPERRRPHDRRFAFSRIGRHQGGRRAGGAIDQVHGTIGGDCVVRAGIGFVTLGLLGFKPRFCVGGMLYRAGPDALRDTMAFCGPGNAGQMIDGHFIGHVWLGLDDELVDFSCADWPDLDPRGELLVAGIDLPPVRWRAPPPTFVWATKGLFDWQPVGSPDIGELWYGPWRGPQPIDFFETLMDQIVPLGEAIVTNLVRMNLPDRVRTLAMAG